MKMQRRHLASRWWLGLMVLSAALLQDGSLRADNVVSVGTTASTAGQSVVLPVEIENDVAIVGFSFGLLHELSSLSPIAVEYAGALNPDFIGSSVTPEGIAFGVLIDFQLEEVIPAGGPSLVAYASYDVLAAGVGSFATVTPGTAGDPPIDVVFALPDATEITPTVSPGGVAVLSPDPEGSPTNRLRVAFDGSFSAFSPEGVLLESEVTSPGAPTDLMVDRNGHAWVLMAETQTVCRVGIQPEPKIVVNTGPEPIVLGPLGGDGVFITHSDGTMQVIHSDGTVLFGGDGQGNGPDGVLGVALDIGSAPFDLFHFAAGPGPTSWLAGGERMVRMQPNGNVVVDVDFGPGYPVQDLAAGPNGSVFVLFNTCVYRMVPDGSLAAYVELPTGTAPTKLAVTTTQGGDERIDRVAVLNPSSNQVFQYDWHHDDVVVAAETLTHNRGAGYIAWDGDRQLWIAGQEAGTSDATLTSYNSDGTPTGVDLTFPGQTILLTENSAAVPAVSAFPDDDFDGDDYSNFNEQVAGSNPFDSTDDPTDEVPDYTPPVDSLSSVIIGDNHFAFLEWTWSSPTADFPQFYEITRTTDGVLAAGFPVQVAGTATSWTDENGGDGLPDGVHEYAIIVIMGGGSNCVTSVLVVGGGETESETPIDVPGSEEGELTEIYDITADPDALPGGIKYYATDSLNGKIYGLDENFVVVVVIPSPFADGEPVTGIAFIKEGFGGIKTLVVGKGSSGGQMHLMEIDLIGNYIRDYFLYNPLPAVPNGQKFLPGAIAGKSGGMGYDESSSTMYITGPDTCEIFGMLHGGDGAINPEQSFPHPNEGAQQKGCTTGNCSGSPWVGCTAPIFITSQTADGTLEIIEVTVSGGVATQVGEGISLAAIDDPGGILFDGENFVITGNSDGTVYEVQATGNFVRGDPNEDGVVDIGDPIYELGYLFVNGPAPECIARLDANDDNLVDIADTIFLLTFLFNNGPQPPEPFDVAGPDPTPSSVTPCP